MESQPHLESHTFPIPDLRLQKVPAPLVLTDNLIGSRLGQGGQVRCHLCGDVSLFRLPHRLKLENAREIEAEVVPRPSAVKQPAYTRSFLRYLLWSYFHVHIFIRVMITLPSSPVDAIGIRAVFAFEIEPIEVRMMTVPIPPCTRVDFCAAGDTVVIIFVPC